LYRDAIEHFQKALDMGGDAPAILGAMGQAHGMDGNQAEAARTLRVLDEMSRTRYVPSTCFALVHIGLGERERALEWLERGIQLREFPMASLGMHPAYDSLREEPRFRVLLKRLGFAFLV
jgi:adenylate cyclase